jgi:hypothetical protein
MKKLVASLSQRAKKEGRLRVTAIVDMGFFLLYGGEHLIMRKDVACHFPALQLYSK